MRDSCGLCNWKDEVGCSFRVHECLQTHMRVAHGVNNSFFMGVEVGF